MWWSCGFCSLEPVFHAHSSCHQKIGFAAVKRHLLPLFSSVCNLMIGSISTGLYLIGAVTLGGTLTNKSSTYTFPSFLGTDFSFFFLFMVHASFFLMNKSLVVTLTSRPMSKNLSHGLRALIQVTRTTWPLRMAVLQRPPVRSGLKRDSRCGNLKDRKALRAPAKLSQSDTAALASRVSAMTGNTARTVQTHWERLLSNTLSRPCQPCRQRPATLCVLSKKQLNWDNTSCS